MFLSGIQLRVWLGLLLAIIIALVLRCPNLSLRPMHTDESVNAIKLRGMMEQGSYHYDPDEHHGPTLYYGIFTWVRILGTKNFSDVSEKQLRTFIVLFGIGLIFLLPLVADGLGRGTLFWAGLLTAVSPAMVFYSRYFIHEMLLVFFTFLALAAFWRHQRSGRILWAVISGVAIGLMQSTKETFVLSLAAAVVALLLNHFWIASKESHAFARPFIFKALLAGWLSWCIVAIFFFSSFFTNFPGVLDSVRTYLPWMSRAAGNSPHVHPWDFYLLRLIWFHVPGGPIWSEGFILVLALVGIVVAITGRGRGEAKQNFLRFVAFYTITLTIFYTSISYKTPWCLLNFWHGFILLAAVGAVALWHYAKTFRLKIAVGLFLAGGTAQLAFQAWQTTETFAADRRNPYVYAQTSPDFLELTETVHALARAAGNNSPLRMDVVVAGDDYWPLPWYLRDFDQVAWRNTLPTDSNSSVLIVSPEFSAKLDAEKIYQSAGMFELRPGTFLALHVDPKLWSTYLETQKNFRR